jgi:hypothetical protein
MADPSFWSGVLQRLVAGWIERATVAGAPPMIAWLKSRRWSWAKIILDTVVGWVCFYVLFNGFTTEPLLSFQWWQYSLGAVSLGVALFLDWRVGRKGTTGLSSRALPRGFWFWAASPSFICLIVEGSYVNPPFGRVAIPRLWVVWANQGDGEIHLGKPIWVANVGKSYGHLTNGSLLYQYLTENRQTKSDEVMIKPGERTELWIGLDPDISIEKLQAAKNAGTLGELTIPVTFGKKKQRTITVRP